MKSNGKKIILVSGGSRGLGAGIVETLLKDPGNIVCTFSRHSTPFIKKIQKKYGRRFLFRQADLSHSADMEALIHELELCFRRLDVLINNAGIAREGVIPVASDETVDEVLDINLKGTIRLTRSATRLMLRGREGCILNISSIIGVRGYAGLSLYSASKAGIIGFTKSLARELGRRNIRVNAIAPGYLETEMSEPLTQGQRAQIIRRTPLGRLGRVEDVTALVKFLISPEAEFMTGQVLIVDGGITC